MHLLVPPTNGILGSLRAGEAVTRIIVSDRGFTSRSGLSLLEGSDLTNTRL